MVFKQSFLMLLFITFLPGFLPGTVVYGQQKTDSLISVNFKNETVRNILEALSKQASLNVSYNASSSAFAQSISYQAETKTALQILEEVLSIINHEYHHLGNHFVIVRSPDTSGKALVNPVTDQVDALPLRPPPRASKQNPTLIRDTILIEKEVPVYRYDTLRIYDTIVNIRTDTIIDTVFMQKSPLPSGGRFRGISANVFRYEADRNQSWAIGFSYAQMAAGYDYTNAGGLNSEEQAIKEAEAFSLRNFKLGISAQYNRNRLNLIAGINLSGFSNRFSWTETSSTGGYFLTDTLDVFYNVLAGDTSWIVIEDSTYIPLDESIKLWDRFNRIGLIELQLSMAYNVYVDDHYFIYIKAGALAGVPIWLNSNSVQNVEAYPAAEVSRDDFPPWVFGYQAGLGMRYAFSNWMDLHAETFYTRYLSPTYANHPLDRNLHGFGLQLGLLYYF